MTPITKKVQVFLLSLAAMFIIVGIYSFASAEKSTENKQKNEEKVVSEESEAYEVSGPLTVEVLLERHYLDGEVSTEVVEETIWSMEDFWATYMDWQLVDQKQGKMIFKKQLDDISPLLKTNGYFGITEDGILTIFNGKPNSEEVIQSFFQIDIEKLESSQHEELKNGIPVGSKDNYQKVLESFKSFSLTSDTGLN